MRQTVKETVGRHHRYHRSTATSGLTDTIQYDILGLT